MVPEAGDVAENTFPHPLRHRHVRHETVDCLRIAQVAAHNTRAQVFLYQVAMMGLGLGQGPQAGPLIREIDRGAMDG